MINIGAVDTHIDPYTHTNEYSREPPVAVCYSCCFTICYKTRGEIYRIPVDQQLVSFIGTIQISSPERFRFVRNFFGDFLSDSPYTIQQIDDP